MAKRKPKVEVIWSNKEDGGRYAVWVKCGRFIYLVIVGGRELELYRNWDKVERVPKHIYEAAAQEYKEYRRTIRWIERQLGEYFGLIPERKEGRC